MAAELFVEAQHVRHHHQVRVLSREVKQNILTASLCPDISLSGATNYQTKIQKLISAHRGKHYWTLPLPLDKELNFRINHNRSLK